MKQHRSPVIALLLSASHLAAQPPAGPIVIGERLQMESKVLGELRPLLVAKPTGYDKETEAYPVLYLLDGDTHFHHATGVVSFLASSGRIPKMLVVAIPNASFESRSRDLTPGTKAEIDLRYTRVHGGADRFLDFLTRELIPFIDHQHRTRAYKLLAGHSYGGLFVVHALTTRPSAFNAYIAIDPSLQWNNEAMLDQTARSLPAIADLAIDLFVVRSGEKVAMSPVAKLAGLVTPTPPNGFTATFQWMPEETHASVPHRGIHQGLDTIFAGWHLANPLALFEKGGLDAVHRHFREGGKRFGYQRQTPESTISQIVTGLLNAGRLEEAVSVLQHDVKSYPPSWDDFDTLARAYDRRGQTQEAVRYYKLSLQANPRNEWARRKLVEFGVSVSDLPAPARRK